MYLPSGITGVPVTSVRTNLQFQSKWMPNCHPIGSLRGSSSCKSGKGMARDFPDHCCLSLAAERSRYKRLVSRSSGVLGGWRSFFDREVRLGPFGAWSDSFGDLGIWSFVLVWIGLSLRTQRSSDKHKRIWHPWKWISSSSGPSITPDKKENEDQAWLSSFHAPRARRDASSYSPDFSAPLTNRTSLIPFPPWLGISPFGLIPHPGHAR